MRKLTTTLCLTIALLLGSGKECLNSSKIGVDKDTLKIKFVDLGFDDLLTPEEWEDGLKKNT